MKVLSIIYFMIFSVFFNLSPVETETETETAKPCADCGTNESITIDDVLRLGPEGTEHWSESWGLADGTFYYSDIVFSDNTRGRLFQGGNSKRYFVENSSGKNYYYINLRAAVRALYLYKKYGCISSKYRY